MGIKGSGVRVAASKLELQVLGVNGDSFQFHALPSTLYKKNIKADGLHACRLARIWCRLLFRAYGASPLRPAARISTQRHRKHTNQHEQSSGNTEHVQGHVPSQRVRRENQRALCCAARQTVLIGVLLVQCWAGEPEQRMMSSHWNE